MDKQDAIVEDPVEPIAKRLKMDDNGSYTVDYLQALVENSKSKLQSILSDEFYEPIPQIKMYIGHVKNIKDLSKIISIINEKIPLKEHNYLKRAFKKDVILCQVEQIDETEIKSIQQFIEEYVSEVKDDFEYFRIIELPARAPKLKKEHLSILKHWSCHFHPNKYLEKMYSGDIFSEFAIQSHRKFMAMTFEVAKWHLRNTFSDAILTDEHLKSTNAAVVVDPMFNRVVTAVFDNREHHPIQHCAMVAIDNVAISQGGGAWSKPDGPSMNKELLEHLTSIYPKVVFGSRKCHEMSSNEVGVLKSPYLCTGYDVYLIREPCVMCAMGLVHARVKRIFFCFRNEAQGALCSKAKLQCESSLNHHFEVFTEFM